MYKIVNKEWLHEVIFLMEVEAPQIAKKIKEIHPKIKVLFTSGYPEEYIAKWGGYFQKSFHKKTIFRK